VLPLFIGNAVRAAGWMTLFGSKGFVNVMLISAGIIDQPLTLMYTEMAVVVGIITVNLPFMVLTLQSVIEGISRSVEEAALSLGAAPLQAFRRVVWPLALPGTLAGTILTFILAMNAYATPVLLGGPKFQMMGPLVYGQFSVSNNWPFGAAVSFVLMAATSLAASLFMVFGLRSPQQSAVAPPTMNEVAAVHWQYGRWALGAGALTWLQTSIYYLLLPQFASVAATGALKAVMNLVLPVLHGYTALSMVLLPTLSQAGSGAVLRSRLRLALPLFLMPALAYCSLATLYHRQVFAWLYAGQYSDVAWLFPIAAPMVIASGVSTVYSTALRAVQRPDRVFWSYALASGATLTIGVLLTARYHLLGAVLGLTLSYTILAALARRHFVQAVAEKESES